MQGPVEGDRFCCQVGAGRRLPVAKTVLAVDHPALYVRLSSALPDMLAVENLQERGLSAVGTRVRGR